MAAGGYPAAYEKGAVINGLDAAHEAGCKVFHAGTAERNGAVVTAGGRVLCVTALGETVQAARDRAYAGVDAIDWQGAYARRDIGHRAIARERGDPATGRGDD
jgi:phosphoribosylamine--glycine ligase